MKTKPYAHQLTAYYQSRDTREFALFMEMGTGKTKVAIDTMCYLWFAKQINQALVIAPKGVLPAWITECSVHMWDTVPVQLVVWNTAKKDGGVGPLYETLLKDDVPYRYLRILIMNVEAISTKRGVLAAKDFLIQGPSLMVVDESTTIKNRSANRSKGVVWLGKMAAYRRILTGMPVEQSPMDLYGQCEFLRPGLLGHRSFYSFRSAYANLVSIKVPLQHVVGGTRTIQKVVGYKDLVRLSTTLKSFSYRITKDECLDLPEKVYQVVEVELTPEQKSVYKTMRDKAVAFLQMLPQEGIGKAWVSSTAVIAITQLLRLHQIVCGHLPMDDGTVEALPHNRLTVLLSLIEETQGKVIIWVSYRRDVLAICEKLSSEYGYEAVVYYYGDIN